MTSEIDGIMERAKYAMSVNSAPIKDDVLFDLIYFTKTLDAKVKRLEEFEKKIAHLFEAKVYIQNGAATGRFETPPHSASYQKPAVDDADSFIFKGQHE